MHQLFLCFQSPQTCADSADIYSNANHPRAPRVLTLGTTLPLPEAPRTPAQDRLRIRSLRNPPEEPGRKRMGPSLATAGTPRKQPLSYLSPPRLTLGAEESVFMDPHGPTIAPRCPTAVIADKTHTFSKRVQIFSAYHKRPALMQPVCTAVSTPCHAGRGHPRCVNVGNDYGKKRLYTPICSNTTALPQCVCHHSAQQERSSPLRKGDESVGKRSHRNHSSSPERVRLL